MTIYKHRKYYKQRKRQLHKRIRIVVIFVILLCLIALAIHSCSNKPNSNNTLPVSPSPQITPTISPTQIVSPSPIVTQAPTAVDPAQQTTNDLLKIVIDQNGIKTAYLTFDDGPTTAVTPKILDILRRYNVKATFFQVGTLIEANPDMSRRVYEEGHLIANHSYSHNYKDIYANSQGFMSEILKTEQLIKNITGEQDSFKLMRYPGGSYNAGSYGSRKQEYKEVLKQDGYYYCDWNSLNGDAEGTPKTPQQLLERTKATIKGKEDVVILMHDAAAKKTTIESLPSIIEYLISEGYTFKRLDNKDI